MDDDELVLNGGDAFLARITQLQTETAANQKALADLNLGKSAVAANDEAGRLLGAAKAKHEVDLAALAKTAETEHAKLAGFVAASRQSAQDAHDAANRKLATAEAQLAKATAAQTAADDHLATAKSVATRIISEAEASAQKIAAVAEAGALDLQTKTADANSAAQHNLSNTQANKAAYAAMLAKFHNATKGL